MKMGPIMKGNGKMIFKMELLKKNGLMEPPMKGSLRKVKKMEKEYFSLMTDQFILANLMLVLLREKGFMNGKTEGLTTASGKILLLMATESLSGRMANDMKVNSISQNLRQLCSGKKGRLWRVLLA